MNLAADAEVAERYALARRQSPANTAVTMLYIGVNDSVVVSGRADEPPSIFRIGVGSSTTGNRYLRHDPPTPLELENAIAAVEDEVMPLAKLVPQPSALVGVGRAIHDTAQVKEGAEHSQVSLSLDDVELVFQRLAAVSEGRPASSSGLPSGKAFAANLLILREFMHHLGFDSITIGTGDSGLLS